MVYLCSQPAPSPVRGGGGCGHEEDESGATTRRNIVDQAMTTDSISRRFLHLYFNLNHDINGPKAFGYNFHFSLLNALWLEFLAAVLLCQQYFLPSFYAYVIEFRRNSLSKRSFTVPFAMSTLLYA